MASTGLELSPLIVSVCLFKSNSAETFDGKQSRLQEQRSRLQIRHSWHRLRENTASRTRKTACRAAQLCPAQQRISGSFNEAVLFFSRLE